jgi:hypothetical protein
VLHCSMMLPSKWTLETRQVVGGSCLVVLYVHGLVEKGKGPRHHRECSMGALAGRQRRGERVNVRGDRQPAS